MASKDSESESITNLEEEAYIAKLKSVLPFSFRFPQGPTKVLDYLYLGSEEDATSMRQMKQLGITHVINCAASYCHTGKGFYGNGVKYLPFEAEDDYEYNIMQHFPQCYAFIEDAKKNHGKVMIHCIMGVNRSGALAVAYLMVSQNIGPITAAAQVRKIRSNILSNDGFQKQLIGFARERGLLHLDADKVSPQGTI